MKQTLFMIILVPLFGLVIFLSTWGACGFKAACTELKDYIKSVNKKNLADLRNVLDGK